MKTFVSNGNSLQLIAPVGGVTGGALYAAGDLVGVVVASALEGEQFTLSLTGVFTVAKVSAQAWTIGAKLYLVAADGNLSTASNSGANAFVGYAESVAANPSATGNVLLRQ
jgi:predicted RecA/RadA family phage recombinase